MAREAWAAVGLAAAVGCGPTVGEGSPGSTQTSGAMATTDEGADTGMPFDPVPRACVPKPQEGVDPFARDPACDAYFGTQEGFVPPEVLVRLVNRTAETIAVVNRTFGCNQPARHFDVLGTMGDRPVQAVNDHCASDWEACALWSPEGSPACLLCATPHPPVILAPGGWYEEPWDAWVISEVTLPATCSATENEESCFAPLSVAAGTYELRAAATPVASCPSSCECELDANGSCQPSTWDDSLEPSSTATATWDGTCASVEIVFGG